MVELAEILMRPRGSAIVRGFHGLMVGRFKSFATFVSSFPPESGILKKN